jgi:hypothetical protein
MIPERLEIPGDVGRDGGEREDAFRHRIRSSRNGKMIRRNFKRTIEYKDEHMANSPAWIII